MPVRAGPGLFLGVHAFAALGLYVALLAAATTDDDAATVDAGPSTAETSATRTHPRHKGAPRSPD
jgi:hypothetical protein